MLRQPRPEPRIFFYEAIRSVAVPELVTEATVRRDVILRIATTGAPTFDVAGIARRRSAARRTRHLTHSTQQFLVHFPFWLWYWVIHKPEASSKIERVEPYVLAFPVLD